MKYEELTAGSKVLFHDQWNGRKIPATVVSMTTKNTLRGLQLTDERCVIVECDELDVDSSLYPVFAVHPVRCRGESKSFLTGISFLIE